MKRLRYIFIALFILSGSVFAKTTTLTSVTGTISGGGTWSNGIPATGDIVVVNSGTTLTIGANFSLAELRLNGGGTVTFNTNSTLSVTGNVTLNYNSGNGSTTLNIVNTTSILNVTGNFIINPPANNNTNTINVNAGILNCGNITTTCTNAAQKTDIRITSGTLTATGYSSTGLQAGANSFRFTGGGTANINGNFTGGAFTGGSGTLNITGSFVPTSFTANTSVINYNGIVPQTITALSYTNLNCSNTSSKSTAATFTVSNNLIINGGTLTLGANLTVSGSLNVNDGTLDCQTFTISGGTFNLASGTSLVSANVDGITTAGALGSIRTTVRNYNAGANYTYNAGAAQLTGNGLPAAVNNLTINNINNVSLSQPVTVDGSLSLVNGNIDIGSNDLSIGTSGSITGTFGNTNMVITSGIGSLKKLGNAATDFEMVYPVGSGGFYTPMEIKTLTASVNPLASIAIHAAPIQKTPSTSALKKYWSITTINLTSVNANINFTYNPLEITGTESNYIPQKFEGTTFILPEGAAINTTTNVISAIGATSLTGDWTALDPSGITPVIQGATSVFGSRTQVYTISPDYSDYNWAVSGGSITSGQGTNSIIVAWDAAAGEGNATVSYTQNGLSVILPTLSVERNDFPFSCFQYKRSVDLKGTMVNGGPHANFQLLVNVTDPTLKSIDNGGHICHNGGYDIYFASDAAGAIPLEYQLDYFDPVAGQLVAWVKIPTLSNVNSTIYLFYGNYSITFDGSTSNVWSSDYVGVYHLGQNLNDQGVSCNDGINVGTSTVIGKIGQGRLFNRNEKDFIQLTNESSFDFDQQMTVSFWMNLNSYPAAGNDWMDYIVKGDNKNWRIVGNKPNATMYYCFGNEYSDDLSAANNSAPVGSWIHIAGTFNGNNAPLPLKNLFVNGVKVSRAANHSSIMDYVTDNSPVLVGMNSQAQDTRAFNGTMDELQISNVYKTDGWIITGYRNQSDPTNVFLSGVEQSLVIPASATGGIASATPNSIFAREYSDLTLSGYTGTSIQWQSSSNNIDFSDLAGKNLTPQQTDPLLANTYFRAMVANGGCPSVSTTTFVMVTPPYITCSDGKRKKITIDDSKYTGTDDLINFPFLLQINNDNDLKQLPIGKVQSINGWDIRFTSSDGINMLPQQVESYNPATGSLLVWVLIPRINASENTEIYMYYGDANFASSDPSISAVFGSEYLGVYHMGTGTGRSLFELNDASVTGNNATNTGTSNIATGKISVASGFNGTSQYVSLPNENLFQISNNGKLTLSAWVNITTYSASAYAKYIDKGTGSWTLRRDNGSSRVEMRQNYQSPEYISAINTGGIATGAWHYLVATYDHEINNMTLYIDGSAAASSKNVPANQIIQNNTSLVRIGSDGGATPGNYFRGNMDEVRIQNVARTTDWIKFEYDNMNAPVGFTTISAETSCSLGAPAPGTASTDNALLCYGQSATLTLTGYDGGIYWQQSTDSANWSYITGANNPILHTGPIVQNTYFRASVSNCCEAFSNAVLISYVGSSPPDLELTVTNVQCNGQSNGAIDLTVSQGSGSFTYLWSNASITQDISLLAIGTYSVTVTDSNNNCNTTGQATLIQPETLSVTISKTDETCPELANGNATATPSGGNVPYSYSWSNAGISSEITGLTNGVYTITVTDFKNCTATTSTTINTTNPAPVAPTSVSSDRDNLCENDSENIFLSATGGSGITLHWFTGNCGDTDIGTANPLSITSPASTTIYYVHWENSCGNSACTSVTVTVNPFPPTTLIHHDE